MVSVYGSVIPVSNQHSSTANLIQRGRTSTWNHVQAMRKMSSGVRELIYSQHEDKAQRRKSAALAEEVLNAVVILPFLLSKNNAPH